MRCFLISLVLACSLCFASGRAAMAEGRFSATDLMNMPASGTLAAGAFGLYANSDGWHTSLGIDVGILPKLEAGLTVDMFGGIDQASLRLKYHLLAEKQDGLGLSVGLQDIGSGFLTPYIVAGKTLASDLTGYLGLGGGSLDGIFLGLNKHVKIFRGADLFVEYDSHTLNLGGRFSIGDGLGIDLGLADLHDVVAGISYVARF